MEISKTISLQEWRTATRCLARISSGGAVHQEFWPKRYERISNEMPTVGPSQMHPRDARGVPPPPFAELPFRLVLSPYGVRRCNSNNGNRGSHGGEVAQIWLVGQVVTTWLVGEVAAPYTPKAARLPQDGRRYRKRLVQMSPTRSWRQRRHHTLPNGRSSTRQATQAMKMMTMLSSWHASPTWKVDLSQDIGLHLLPLQVLANQGLSILPLLPMPNRSRRGQSMPSSRARSKNAPPLPTSKLSRQNRLPFPKQCSRGARRSSRSVPSHRSPVPRPPPERRNRYHRSWLGIELASRQPRNEKTTPSPA